MSITIRATGAALLSLVKEGTLTANGTEQTVVETSGLMYFEGYIDLSNMQAGDSITISQYMKIKDGGSYIKYSGASYSNVQANPLVYITVKSLYRGVKVTLQQTAGVNRDYDYEFVKES